MLSKRGIPVFETVDAGRSTCALLLGCGTGGMIGLLSAAFADCVGCGCVDEMAEEEGCKFINSLSTTESSPLDAEGASE